MFIVYGLLGGLTFAVAGWYAWVLWALVFTFVVSKWKPEYEHGIGTMNVLLGGYRLVAIGFVVGFIALTVYFAIVGTPS